MAQPATRTNVRNLVRWFIIHDSKSATPRRVIKLSLVKPGHSNEPRYGVTDPAMMDNGVVISIAPRSIVARYSISRMDVEYKLLAEIDVDNCATISRFDGI